MLDENNCLLIVVDIQEKLTAVMAEKETLLKNASILVRGFRELGVPILWLEQVPSSLGQTVAPLVEELAGLCEPIDKNTFSCCGNKTFMSRLNALNRDQVILTGIETHVCIYQTALELYSRGFEPQVPADAVSSRTIDNKSIALDRLSGEGVKITSTETVLFELLKSSTHEKFRAIAKLIK